MNLTQRSKIIMQILQTVGKKPQTALSLFVEVNTPRTAQDLWDSLIITCLHKMLRILCYKYVKNRCWKQWAVQKKEAEPDGDLWFAPTKTFKNSCTAVCPKRHAGQSTSWVLNGARTEEKLYETTSFRIATDLRWCIVCTNVKAGERLGNSSRCR